MKSHIRRVKPNTARPGTLRETWDSRLMNDVNELTDKVQKGLLSRYDLRCYQTAIFARMLCELVVIRRCLSPRQRP